MGQRLGRLVSAEGQVGFAHRHRAAQRGRRVQGHVDLDPADHHDAQARRGVADERPEHRQGRGDGGDPLELVDHQHHWHLPDRLGEQPRRLGVGQACRQCRGGHAAGGGRRGGQRRLEVGHQPAGGGVGVVEGEPGHLAPEPWQGLGHGRGLARARGRAHPHERMALDELSHQAVDSLADHQPLG